jgi:predicted AAA+ superfamily ATPase
VNSVRIISGPEILRISISVVPPGIRNFIKFKWGVVTIVLNKYKIVENLFQFELIKEIYFYRLMTFS